MNIQKQIISQLQYERIIVAGNKKLIEIFTQKIQDKISMVWGINQAQTK